MFFSNKAEADVKPFDVFEDAYTLMQYLGAHKLHNPKSQLRKVAHNFYRCLTCIMIIIYTIQHWVYILQKISAAQYDRVLEGLVLTVPHLTLLCKIFVFSWRGERLEQINNLIKGPVFAVHSSQDHMLICNQFYKMYFYFRSLHGMAVVCCVCWVTGPFLRRYQGDEDILVTVFPFHIETWPRFVMATFYDTILFYPSLSMTHLTIDYIFANYYCFAQVQLQILKNNLKTIFGKNENKANNQTLGTDIGNNDMKFNFIRLLKRYDKIVWYLYEIQSIVNVAITTHFFFASGEMCLVVFMLGTLKGFTTQHILYIMLMGILQVQVLLYCYYCELVKTESESIIAAVYESDWLSISPRFRKQLVIAMCRWQKPLEPTVASIVPLSLTTYVSVLKTAYSIYSFMITKS